VCPAQACLCCILSCAGAPLPGSRLCTGSKVVASAPPAPAAPVAAPAAPIPLAPPAPAEQTCEDATAGAVCRSACCERAGTLHHIIYNAAYRLCNCNTQDSSLMLEIMCNTLSTLPYRGCT